MKQYEQEAPFAVQLEPVEGCSLACSFCALQSIRDNGADAQLEIHGKNSVPYRFASLNMIDKVAKDIARLGWNPRIEFAMHGEPTMHPDLPALVRNVRRHLPKAYIMVTTNGSGITTPAKVMALFRGGDGSIEHVDGIDTLAFDDYKHANWRTKTREALVYCSSTYDIPLFQYPQNGAGNPHHRFKGKRITCITDISDNSDGTHKLTNQGGNSGPAESLEQRCAKPFRELSIRWDGAVALCCDDWKGSYKIGNVNAMLLEEIWQHMNFNAARMALYAGKRSAIGVCSGCNVRTYRNGLLPDKFGKVEMPALNPYAESIIRYAQRGRTFSIKLKRGD